MADSLIPRRVMPGTALELSVIALGTVPLGGPMAEDQAFRLLDLYVELGGNFIDSAAIYNDWLPGERSAAEKRIGRWLKSRRPGDTVIVATKGAHPHIETMNQPRVTPQAIREDVARSRENLGLERLPLYYLHRDDPRQPVGELMDALAEAVAAGQVGHVGCSNWTAGRIVEAQDYAAKTGRPPFVADQMRWSLARVNPASQSDPTLVEMYDDLYDCHTRTGLAAVAYSSQAQGFFSGAYGRGLDHPAPPQGEKVKGYYYNETNFARLERVLELSRRLGRPPTQVAAAWLLNQPFATWAVIGVSSADHLRESAAAGDIRLSPEEICWLESGTKGTRLPC